MVCARGSPRKCCEGRTFLRPRTAHSEDGRISGVTGSRPPFAGRVRLFRRSAPRDRPLAAASAAAARTLLDFGRSLMHFPRRTRRQVSGFGAPWASPVGGGFLAAAFLVALVVATGGCSTNGLSDSGGNGLTPTYDAAPGSCAPGREGCSCAAAGEMIRCGHLVSTYGTYVTCSEGTSTCQNGAWGPCLGNTTLTKSLVSHALGSGGLRLQSNPQSCTD